MDCEIIMFEVERKVFTLCPTRTIDFDCLWCKIYELCNFELVHHCNAHHVRYLYTKSQRQIISGTYSNAPCTEEGCKKFPLHLAILEEFLVISVFHETKISTIDMKVQVYSKFSKILNSKLHEDWKISFPQVQGQAKLWECFIPILPKCQAHLHNTKIVKKCQNCQKRKANLQFVRQRAVANGRPLVAAQLRVPNYQLLASAWLVVTDQRSPVAHPQEP